MKQKTAALEPRRRTQSNKLGYKEERELADLPDKLKALEREQVAKSPASSPIRRCIVTGPGEVKRTAAAPRRDRG